MRRALLFALVVATAIVPSGAEAQAKSPKVASHPVTFTVQNVNRSLIPCTPGGGTYKLRGHATGPASALSTASRKKRRAKKSAVTLYLHGLGLGEWFWRFEGESSRGLPPGVPAPAATAPVISGYDYAQAQAKRGHVSVTIDRLGYGASDYVDGNKICLGSHADMAHQVVQALKSGSYTVTGGSPARYKTVALAGHSIGGQIAMAEAYSFRDVSDLIVASFSFANLPRAQLALGPTRDTCLRGGEPPFVAPPNVTLPLGPPPAGYAPYGTGTPADFQDIMLHSATPQVRDAATSLRSKDPCGDIASIIAALLQQRALLPKVKVPVLIVCGTKDALYNGLACKMLGERFTRSRSVKVELVRNAAHAITVERPAATFGRKISRWLKRRGL
jgi:pimeloyl-ACP methyl ester carboxylesterase